MRLLGKKMLHNFKDGHADARSQVESWENEVEDAKWNTPHDLKKRYPKARILGKQQVIFDICWNRYRLLVKVSYQNKIVIVTNIGTHKEYKKWDIE